jgi:hypothetical protein
LSKEGEEQTTMAAKMEALERDRQIGPMMVATLEPGLAWMDMATVDGVIRRRHPAVAAAAVVAGGGAAPLALPPFPGDHAWGRGPWREENNDMRNGRSHG